MTVSERVMAQVVRGLTVVLAAAGAGIGAAFATDLHLWQRLVVGVVSGLLGVALALLFVARAEKPAPVIPPPPRPMPSPPPAPPAPQPDVNGQWWQQTGKPTTATKPVAARKESVPLKDFDAHRAQIAQCPRCGGFELDVRRDGHACAFTCRNPDCRATWEWLPGTAWPATVVRRNLTRAVSADEERR
ncbi:MAG: hypothetical protein HOY78_45045 [Saccharothrix sp.]|nr:hypothetical protein [Saccharothrix sp.]